MWKDFTLGYLRHNRAAGLSIVIAAFLSALFLSLICGLLYNAWKYEVERITLEEGGWHSRIALDDDRITLHDIQDRDGLREAALRQEKAGTLLELTFDGAHNAISATQTLASELGCDSEAISYHYALLAMYFVRDAQDSAPRLLFPLFLCITFLASMSLILVIHNAFAASMNARMHQLGILSSIGATPRQIRACLVQEAAALCAVPILVGSLMGIGGSMGLVLLVNVLLGRGIAGRHVAVFGYHPLVFLITLALAAVTVWLSAWLPAGKLSRRTPLEAIRNGGEFQLKRRRRAPVLAALFGVEGELAGMALKAQRKTLRTASLSLAFSFLAFAAMQCFFTLSGISTRETYFERYQGVWDLMVTVKDADVDALPEISGIQALPEVKSAIAYQRFTAKTVVSAEELSADMAARGGFSQADGDAVQKTETGWLVQASLVILDDDSFLQYCGQAGAVPGLDGVIVLNQIRDAANPDFRHPQYMPYLEGGRSQRVLMSSGGDGGSAEIAVLSYTTEVPVLRESYDGTDAYALVYVFPASLWQDVKAELTEDGADTLICIRAAGAATEETLEALERRVAQALGAGYAVETENRIRERAENDRQIRGMMALFGSFCVLLALIGLGSVFTNTLSFVRQRKREFARYLSVGLTPAGLRNMLGIEALVLARRPVLLVLPLVALMVWFFLRMSYLEPSVFLAEAPYLPVAAFLLWIFGAVALAYALGWRHVRKLRLAEVLRDDTML